MKKKDASHVKMYFKEEPTEEEKAEEAAIEKKYAEKCEMFWHLDLGMSSTLTLKSDRCEFLFEVDPDSGDEAWNGHRAVVGDDWVIAHQFDFTRCWCRGMKRDSASASAQAKLAAGDDAAAAPYWFVECDEYGDAGCDSAYYLAQYRGAGVFRVRKIACEMHDDAAGKYAFPAEAAGFVKAMKHNGVAQVPASFVKEHEELLEDSAAVRALRAKGGLVATAAALGAERAALVAAAEAKADARTAEELKLLRGLGLDVEG